MSVINDFYSKAEDKWYDLVDKVSVPVPFVGKSVDWVEEKGLPSLPAFIGLIVLLLIAGFFLFSPAEGTLSGKVFGLIDGQLSAMEGAKVILFDGETSQETTTDDSGIFSFNVKNGTNYSLTATMNGYADSTKVSFTPSFSILGSSAVLDLNLGSVNATKEITLANVNSQILSDSGSLVYLCDGETRTTSFANGRFDATGCSTVEIEEITGYRLVKNISFSGVTDQAIVEKLPVDTGTVVINLIAPENEQLKNGLRVSLVNEMNRELTSSVSNGSLVTFATVPVGRIRVLVSDSISPISYAPYTNPEFKVLSKDGQINFDVNLEKAGEKKVISLYFKDGESPVQGINYSISLQGNESSPIRSGATGETGIINAELLVGQTYVISGTRPDYVLTSPSVLSVSASTPSTFIIQMAKANSGNSSLVEVNVSDTLNFPVEGARVVLRKVISGGTINSTAGSNTSADSELIGEKVAGVDGIAAFDFVELGTYFIEAFKDGFASSVSQQINVTSLGKSVVSLKLQIASGTITVKVFDKLRNPAKGISITAMNSVTKKQESKQSANANGEASFTIRTDKKIFFIIEGSAYARYFTSTMRTDATLSIIKEVIMEDPVSKLSASIESVVSGGEILGGREVSSGFYTINARVRIPKGSFSELGFHLRTGKSAVGRNLMEEDSSRFTGIESSATKQFKSTSYSPENGMDFDLKNVTTGEFKWVNLTWQNPQEGVYEIQSELAIDNLSDGEKVNLEYRTWAKSSSILRYPEGSAKNELYAATNNYVLLQGAPLMCTESFCKSYSLTQLTGSQSGKKFDLVGSPVSIEAKQNTDYSFEATLTSISSKAIKNAIISVEGKGVSITGLTIANDQVQLADSKNNKKLISSFGKDQEIKITGNFKPTISGSYYIRIRIDSEQKTEFIDNIIVNVPSNKKMSLDIIPRQVIPFIKNVLSIVATDNSSSIGSANSTGSGSVDSVGSTITDSNNLLEGVLIEIFVDGTRIASMETSASGRAIYELSAPAAGSVVRLIATKEGYEPLETIIGSDGKVASFLPFNVEEDIVLGEVIGFSRSIIVQNNTVKDLLVKAVQAKGDLKSYFDIKLPDISSAIIQTGKDKNFILAIKTNALAQRIQEPKTITGTVAFEFEVQGTGQRFISELPVSLRLTMPGFLDTAKCLKILQVDSEKPVTSIGITTSAFGTTETLVDIENTCTANGINIPLRGLLARVTSENKFGKIVVAVQGVGNKPTELGTAFSNVTDFLEGNSKETLVIKFTPSSDASSGKEESVITFRGVNVLDGNGQENVDAQLKLGVTMNDLVKCIEVQQPVGGIAIDMAGLTNGYVGLLQSQYGNGFIGGMPYGNMQMINGQLVSVGGVAGGTGVAGVANTGATIGGVSYNANSSAPFGLTNLMPGMTQGYGYGYGGNMALSQQSSFVIKNNCENDVDIDLDPDASVGVDTEKFSVTAGDDARVVVKSGYTYGVYNVVVNAKLTGSKETKKKLTSVPVIVRSLGSMDTDCIKLNFNSIDIDFIAGKEQVYEAYNNCYYKGFQFNKAIELTCDPFNTPGQAATFQNALGQTSTDPRVINLQNGTGVYQANYGLQPGQQLSSVLVKPSTTASCQLISRVRYAGTRIMTDGGQQIEQMRIGFKANINYIPQTALFDASKKTYGFFDQVIQQPRQFLTETESRLNAIAILGLGYVNQYRQTQTQSFDVRITDTLGALGQALDAAMNSGDTSADPSECVSVNMKNDALNIYKKNNGAIPEAEYANGNIFDYVPTEPPAVKIGGPSKAQQISVASNANDRKKQNDGFASNCGLADKLSDIKTDFVLPAGLKIDIVPTKAGNVILNKMGPNLNIVIDRTNFEGCMFIDAPVKATLTRFHNNASAELTWNLKVLVTGKNYPTETLKGLSEDAQKAICNKTGKVIPCLDVTKQIINSNPGMQSTEVLDALKKSRPDCAGQITTEIVNSIKSQAANKSICELDNKALGFDKIKFLNKTDAGVDDATNGVTATYCNNYFCNAGLLGVFAGKNFEIIRKKVFEAKTNNEITCNVIGTSGAIVVNPVALSDVLNEIKTTTVTILENGSVKGNETKFVLQKNGTALVEKTVPTDELKKIVSSTANVGTVDSTINLIGDIVAKPEYASGLFLKVTNEAGKENKLVDNLIKLKLAFTLGDSNYLPLKNYYEIMSACKNATPSSWTTGPCELTSGFFATQNSRGLVNNLIVTIAELAAFEATNIEFAYLVERATIVPADVELIKKEYPTLYALNDLRTLNNNGKTQTALMAKGDLTVINFTPSTATTPVSVDVSVGTTKAKDSEIASYDLEFDYNICTDNFTNAKLNLTKPTIVSGSKFADKNPMLLVNLDVLPDDLPKLSTTQYRSGVIGLIIDDVGVERFVFNQFGVPLVLSVTLPPSEAGLAYRLKDGSTNGNNALLKWNTAAPVSEVLSNGIYSLNGIVPNPTVVTILKSLFYVTESGDGLIFVTPTNTTGLGGTLIAGTKTAQGIRVLGSYGLPGRGGTPTTIDYTSIFPMTAKELIDKAFAGEVCVKDNTLVWNEQELLK